jgi:hypothetical protein
MAFLSLQLMQIGLVLLSALVLLFDFRPTTLLERSGHHFFLVARVECQLFVEEVTMTVSFRATGRYGGVQYHSEYVFNNLTGKTETRRSEEQTSKTDSSTQDTRTDRYILATQIKILVFCEVLEPDEEKMHA